MKTGYTIPSLIYLVSTRPFMHLVNRGRVGRSPVLCAATEKIRTEMERTSETVMKLIFLVVCDVNADADVKALVVDSRYCATIFMVDMPYFEQI